MALQGIVTQEGLLKPEDLNQFASEIKRLNRAVGQECRDTARALVLYGSGDPRLQDIGYDYLLSMNEMEPADRTLLGHPARCEARPTGGQRSLAPLGTDRPSVVAVDQIDTILARSDLPESAGGIRNDRISTVNLVGDGLLSLREITRRTVSVVSCLPRHMGRHPAGCGVNRSRAFPSDNAARSDRGRGNRASHHHAAARAGVRPGPLHAAIRHLANQTRGVRATPQEDTEAAAPSRGRAPTPVSA